MPEFGLLLLPPSLDVLEQRFKETNSGIICRPGTVLSFFQIVYPNRGGTIAVIRPDL